MPPHGNEGGRSGNNAPSFIERVESLHCRVQTDAMFFEHTGFSTDIDPIHAVSTVEGSVMSDLALTQWTPAIEKHDRLHRPTLLLLQIAT
jgi:hypothetical protein